MPNINKRESRTGACGVYNEVGYTCLVPSRLMNRYAFNITFIQLIHHILFKCLNKQHRIRVMHIYLSTAAWSVNAV